MDLSFIKISEQEGGYAFVDLQRNPVNSMNLDFWEQLTAVLDSLEKNPRIRAMIIRSALEKNVFTAGNDLLELYAPKTSKERYTKFWVVQNKFLARLMISPLLTIAAGGCCIAMCCDFRILTQDAVMGLNEVSIGISVPAMWIKLMASLIGQGAAFKLCQFGTNVNAQRAKLIGLADEIVLQSTDLESKCVEIVTKCLKLPDTGRQITKHSCRIELFSEWSSDARLQVEAEHGWKMLSMPSTVKFMTQVMQRLKSKI